MVEQLRLDQVETPEFLDTIYTLLADSHRRDVLHHLITHRNPVSVHRLAAELAAVDHDVAVTDVTSRQQEEVFLTLSHVHLPLLHDTGMVSWDREAERVTLTPFLEHLTVTISEPGGLLDVSFSDRSERS